jgi:hypothetical protein
MENNYSKELLFKGILYEEKLIINPDLTSAEKTSTLKQLDDARASGFDSCAVTNIGTFANKRL